MRTLLILIYDTLFINPLYTLYMHGPTIMDRWGFWNGRTPPEICTILTKRPEAFWVQNHLECKQMIDQEFYTFLVCIYTGMYIIGLYLLWKSTIFFIRLGLLIYLQQKYQYNTLTLN